MSKVLPGAVCPFKDNPKVIGGHGERRYQSPILFQNFADETSGLFFCHRSLLPRGSPRQEIEYGLIIINPRSVAIDQPLIRVRRSTGSAIAARDFHSK
jgi:hypothetical protein